MGNVWLENEPAPLPRKKRVFKPEQASRINERWHVALFDRDGNVREEREFPTDSSDTETHTESYMNARSYIESNIRRKRWDGDAVISHRYQLDGDPRNKTYPNSFYSVHNPHKTGRVYLRHPGYQQLLGAASKLPDVLAVPIPVQSPIEEVQPTNEEASSTYATNQTHIRRQAEFTRWGNGSQYR